MWVKWQFCICVCVYLYDNLLSNSENVNMSRDCNEFYVNAKWKKKKETKKKRRKKRQKKKRFAVRQRTDFLLFITSLDLNWRWPVSTWMDFGFAIAIHASLYNTIEETRIIYYYYFPLHPECIRSTEYSPHATSPRHPLREKKNKMFSPIVSCRRATGQCI